MASRYYYSFDVHESPVRDWEEDDDMGWFATVELRLWKLEGSSSAEAGAVVGELGRRGIELHLGEVVAENEEEGLNVSTCLSEIGVPEMCHPRMIAQLMEYIEAEVILSGRYPRHAAVMDIVHASSSSSSARVVEEALRASIDHVERRTRRRWTAMDITRSGTLTSWAGGDIWEAVRILRTGWRAAIQHRQQWARDDDVEEAVAQEYAAKMVPAGEAAIASLKKVQRGAGETLSCVICIGEEDEELGFSRMPCKHAFHTVCVQTWLRVSSSCPVCRYLMLPASC